MFSRCVPIPFHHVALLASSPSLPALNSPIPSLSPFHIPHTQGDACIHQRFEKEFGRPSNTVGPDLDADIRPSGRCGTHCWTGAGGVVSLDVLEVPSGRTARETPIGVKSATVRPASLENTA